MTYLPTADNSNPIIHYKAYIAGNVYSEAFDHAYGKSRRGAIAQVKRQNTGSWQDCFVWSVAVHADGQEER
jgi:hypothetical protein